MTTSSTIPESPMTFVPVGAIAPKVASGSFKKERLSLAQIQALFDLPFNDLLFQAQTVHRQHFNAKPMVRVVFAWARHGESCMTEMLKKSPP